MLKRILLGLGGTPYTTSEVQHAVELAAAHGAELTGVTVMDLGRISDVGPVPIGAGAASASLVNYRLEVTKQAVNQAVRIFEEECDKAGVRHHVISEAGNPFEELICLWRYHDITVLALQSLFEYGVVQDPKDMLLQVISKGVRPILAVARNARPIKRVLIAYNGSMESAKAMKQFAQWNLWPDVDTRLVCFEMPREKALPFLNDAADYLKLHGFRPEIDSQTGDATDELLPCAKQWSADLIVLGATARARIFRRMMGDVALKAIRESEIPLFMTQ